MARLKTYTAEIDGLNQWIVAAPNQKAALEAFGVRQNLFAEGLAAPTTEPALVKAAEASPGAPLKRAKGGKGAFAPATAGSDWAQALKATGKAGKPRKPPSRAALDRARAALAKVEGEIEADLAALETAVEAARRRLAEAQARGEARRAKAEAAVEKAQADYRKAGG